MREGREERNDENHVPEKHKKNAVASGESSFYMLKIQKKKLSPAKKTELIVKRPFPFFFCKKRV